MVQAAKPAAAGIVAATRRSDQAQTLRSGQSGAKSGAKIRRWKRVKPGFIGLLAMLATGLTIRCSYFRRGFIFGRNIASALSVSDRYAPLRCGACTTMA
jgi:hypothetical protein